MSDHGLPAGVRYDGPLVFPQRTVMMFTDEGTGSSFALAPADATPARIAAAAAEVRRRFAEAESSAAVLAGGSTEPLPPVYFARRISPR